MTQLYSPTYRSFKTADYPQIWVIPNKGIIPNCKDDLICFELLDVFRVVCFVLEFDSSYISCKSSCTRVFQWNIYRIYHLMFCTRYMIFVRLHVIGPYNGGTWVKRMYRWNGEWGCSGHLISSVLFWLSVHVYLYPLTGFMDVQSNYK